MSDHSNHLSLLQSLNEKVAQMEEQRDDDAVQFFERHLSEQLVFRRTDGSVVGKRGAAEPKSFMDTLTGPSPFLERRSQDIHVDVLGDRAVVRLIVVGTKRDGSVHCYRNIRFWSHSGEDWQLDSWYNFELTGG
ncbi:nuclear transport factor 2 family protein [Mesorhizobium sp. WSM2561]|uniref:nuclear transport factor 2 family protein n=1 Tax=Mesorhizobium sp. WSM2561 TaxID=1040985 RepID=UPI000487FA1A|nr:nuclear transport factor 2 family protein [Mesorhizobium sp. WSM2561]